MNTTMPQSWLNCPYLVIVVASVVVSIDAIVVALFLGQLVNRVTLGSIIRIPGRFAISHLFIAFLGWLMAAPVRGWLSYTSMWILAGLLLLVGWRGLKHYSPLVEKLKSSSFELSGAKLDIIALATGIDSLLVGILAVSVGISAVMASVTAGGTVFALSCAAYVGEGFFSTCGRAERKVGGHKIKRNYSFVNGNEIRGRQKK